MKNIESQTCTIKNARLEKTQGAIGKSVICDLEVKGAGVDDAEIYQPSGFLSIPIDDIQGIIVKVNGQNIIVAMTDYNFAEPIVKGETIVFSTDKDTGAILSQLKLDKDGLVTLKNDVTSLKILFDDFIKAFTDSFDSTGAPTLHNKIGPLLTAALASLQSKVDTLFKE